MRLKAWKIFSGINCDDSSGSFESSVMILSTVSNHLWNHNPRVTAKVATSCLCHCSRKILI